MKGYTSFTGNWHEQETVHTGRFEMNIREKPRGEVGEFQYMPYFFKKGNYKDIWSPSASKYEAKVPVTIHHMSGEDKKIVNQQKNGRKWLELGSYTFEKGHHLAITIYGERDKHVIADAFKFEFIE